MSTKVMMQGENHKVRSPLAAATTQEDSTVAALGLATQQLDALRQIEAMTTQDGSPGQEEVVAKTAVGSPPSLQADQSHKEQKIAFNQNSVFEAAGTMSKLQAEMSQSLVKYLKHQLAMMQAELDFMEAAATFWKTFGSAWESYLANPSYNNFIAVIHLLEEKFQGDPTILAQLQSIEQQGTNAKIKQDYWDDPSEENYLKIRHLFFEDIGDLVDLLGIPINELLNCKNAWSQFTDSLEKGLLVGNISDIVDGNMGIINAPAGGSFQPLFVPLKWYVEKAVGGEEMLSNLLVNGQEAFQTKIRRLSQVVKILIDILKIVESATTNPETALFHMEALLMDLQQLQISTNSGKSEQQQQISHNNGENLENNLKEIQKTIEKIIEQNKHKGGIWGFFEKLFTGKNSRSV